MLPTLKGVFPQPKIQHKRDFVRENKLHLKDLQRISSRQQLQNAEEEEKLAELRRRQRHKSLDTRPFLLSRRRPSSGCSCECLNTMQTGHCARPVSSATNIELRKVETCNQEVQTDDIVDEEFLYQALKRCSSTDVGEDAAYNLVANNLAQPTLDDHFHVNEAGSNFNINFHNLAIDTDRLPPSNSSTQMSTKRTTRKTHELGDRQDVRLPKYLEREKREKEIKKQRELERDPHCPSGYEPLTEEERQSSLNTAQKKFQALIGELNHMPMTTETLRMRNRKMEIERELVELENDIRIFSKPKVYVKANGIGMY